jgi:plastocyanin
LNVAKLLRRASVPLAAVSLIALAPQVSLADGQLNALAAAGPAAAESSPAPAAAAPQAPAMPPLNITVQISDKGFDAQSYTASTIPWPSPNNGTVTFKNVGTQVHTATFLPGTQGYGVRWLSMSDAKGTLNTCFSNPSIFAVFTDGCSRTGLLDTGGIEPGGSATLAFPNGAGNFTFTSATDCLNGNARPGFNCAPSTLTEVPNPGDQIAIFQPGSSINSPGGTDCAITKTVSNGSICFTKGPEWTTVGGSPEAPLTNPTVTIDDIKGFQPTVLYVAAGSTITWVNKGSRVHSVSQYGPYFWQFGTTLDKGIAPGESYSYTMGCNAGPGGSCAGVSEGVASMVSEDMIAPSQNGAVGPNSGVCMQGVNAPCGVPAMTGEIFSVPAH